MNKANCQVLSLCENGATRIGYCQDCRVFHVQVGYATLQINSHAFVCLGAAINQALAMLENRNPGTKDEWPNTVPELKNVTH